MFAVLKKCMTGYERYVTQVSRERAREILLRSDDRMLADAGFSRSLLEEGVAAWPWRSDAVNEAGLPPIQLDLVTHEQAIRTLTRSSQPELGVLDDSHSLVADVVENRRSVIDQTDRRKVA